MKHDPISPFNRQFFHPTENFTIMGTGEIGGKASGLAFMKDLLHKLPSSQDEAISVSIPRLTVITTTYFDRFMKQNYGEISPR